MPILHRSSSKLPTEHAFSSAFTDPSNFALADRVLSYHALSLSTPVNASKNTDTPLRGKKIQSFRLRYHEGRLLPSARSVPQYSHTPIRRIMSGQLNPAKRGAGTLSCPLVVRLYLRWRLGRLLTMQTCCRAAATGRSLVCEPLLTTLPNPQKPLKQWNKAQEQQQQEETSSKSQ